MLFRSIHVKDVTFAVAFLVAVLAVALLASVLAAVLAAAVLAAVLAAAVLASVFASVGVAFAFAALRAGVFNLTDAAFAASANADETYAPRHLTDAAKRMAIDEVDGLALAGELGKWVGVSSSRWLEVTTTPTSMLVEARGGRFGGFARLRRLGAAQLGGVQRDVLLALLAPLEQRAPRDGIALAAVVALQKQRGLRAPSLRVHLAAERISVKGDAPKERSAAH